MAGLGTGNGSYSFCNQHSDGTWSLVKPAPERHDGKINPFDVGRRVIDYRITQINLDRKSRNLPPISIGDVVRNSKINLHTTMTPDGTVRQYAISDSNTLELIKEINCMASFELRTATEQSAAAAMKTLKSRLREIAETLNSAAMAARGKAKKDLSDKLLDLAHRAPALYDATREQIQDFLTTFGVAVENAKLNLGERSLAALRVAKSFAIAQAALAA